MKKFTFILSIVMVLGFTTLGNATLWDRGGGLIYDDQLNITWLQDANYAKTSGYNSDGRMTWTNAVVWVEQLVYSGYFDWRLPNILPINGIGYITVPNWSNDGSTDRGYNISAPGSVYAGSKGSELAYMYFNNLGNLSAIDVNLNPQNYQFKNIGPFINLQSEADGSTYMSGQTGQISYPNHAWEFYWWDGHQDYGDTISNLNYAWAVRDGDSHPIPEPATMLLLGLGLIGLAGARRKFKK